MLKCTPIQFSYETNSNNSYSSPSKTPEYSPLPIKHQMYYQQNVKIDMDPRFHDDEQTQRTERTKSVKSPTPKLIQDQMMRVNEELSFHHNDRQPNDQERKTHRSQQESQYEIELRQQKEKVQNLLQYQQAILEQLEESSFTVQQLMQQNEQLSMQLQESDNQLMLNQRASQDQIAFLRQKVDLAEQRNTHLKKITLQLENNNKNTQLIEYQDNSEGQKDRKFANCVRQMIQVCHPPQSTEISFKQAWKWLKSVLEEYMVLKKAEHSSRTLRPTVDMRFSNTHMSIPLKKSDVRVEYPTRSKDRIQSHDSSVHVGQFIRSNRGNIPRTEHDLMGNFGGKDSQL